MEVLRDQAQALLPKAGLHADRLNWLLPEIDWVLKYWHAATVVNAEELLDKNKAGEALATRDAGDLTDAMGTYATRTSAGSSEATLRLRTPTSIHFSTRRATCMGSVNRHWRKLVFGTDIVHPGSLKVLDLRRR